MKKAAVKKVLILGGSKRMVEAVEAAKKMGVYTIVVDHAEEAPVKKYPAKSQDINPADVIRLAEIGETEKLDGIFTLFDDVTTWNALALCKRLDVPFYATREQLKCLPNREKFQGYCRTFNVSVIDELALAGKAEEMNGAVLEFPLILNSYAGKRSEYATL